MEDTPQPGKQGTKVGAVAEVQVIALRAIHWKVQDLELNAPIPILVEPPTVNVSIDRLDGGIRYRVETALSGKLANSELFRLECRHDVVFSLPEDFDPESNELMAFANTSVFFMLYPYLRELLASLTSQAGIPTVILRPLRILFELSSGEMGAPNVE